MTRRLLLVRISAAQLIAGVAGLTVGIARSRNYDLGFLRGHPDHVLRDAVLMGTAYSAPVPMLVAQLRATRQLAQGPDDGARRMLGMLGALMVPGYLMERHGRAHLRPGGFDPLETPVVVAGVGLAAAMAVLGHQAASAR
ncbi:MAG: hypothetical protein JWM71_1980 [Solirubrobacteraceae bacterium]|nr:hypothetical protein [Solirubrobacteraceae bacterium]